MKNLKDKKRLCIGAMVLLVLVIGLGVVFFAGRSDDREKYHILCIGVDKDVPMSERDILTGSIGQADALYLVTVDRVKEEVDILAIPRDTMVEIEKYDSNLTYLGKEMGQICIQYAYADGLENSCELTCDRVESLLHDVKIDHYIAINMKAIADINDAVGGVEVTIDDEYLAYQMSEWNGWTVTLRGDDVVEYLRIRNTSESGTAYDRTARITSYVNAFMQKAKEQILKKPTVLFKIFRSMDENMVTDMNLGMINNLRKSLEGISPEQIHFYTLEGEIVHGHTGYEEFYPEIEQLMELNELLK